MKRQKEIKDPATTRLREGDRVLACVAGSTRATVVFFSTSAPPTRCRIIDVPATTGYGEPIQKLFKLKDGEKIVARCSRSTPRVIGDHRGAPRASCPKTYARRGHAATATRFGSASTPFLEPSTRAGRRYARARRRARRSSASRIVTGDETVIAATQKRRALLCTVDEMNFLVRPPARACC